MLQFFPKMFWGQIQLKTVSHKRQKLIFCSLEVAFIDSIWPDIKEVLNNNKSQYFSFQTPNSTLLRFFFSFK